MTGQMVTNCFVGIFVHSEINSHLMIEGVLWAKAK
jgi:hypothetical protein